MKIHSGNILAFKRLAHKILMIKSSSFIKLALTLDTSFISNQSQADNIQALKVKASRFVDIFNTILSRSSQCFLQDAMEHIKLQGWKTIPEAPSQDQDDSCSFQGLVQKFISSGTEQLSKDKQQSKFFSDGQIVQNKEYIIEDRYCHKKSYPLLYQINQSTQYTSTLQSKSLRRAKRLIILKKIQNIQLCVNYLIQSKKMQQKLSYHQRIR